MLRAVARTQVSTLDETEQTALRIANTMATTHRRSWAPAGGAPRRRGPQRCPPPHRAAPGAAGLHAMGPDKRKTEAHSGAQQFEPATAYFPMATAAHGPPHGQRSVPTALSVELPLRKASVLEPTRSADHTTLASATACACSTGTSHPRSQHQQMKHRLQTARLSPQRTSQSPIITDTGADNGLLEAGCTPCPARGWSRTRPTAACRASCTCSRAARSAAPSTPGRCSTATPPPPGTSCRWLPTTQRNTASHKPALRLQLPKFVAPCHNTVTHVADAQLQCPD